MIRGLEQHSQAQTAPEPAAGGTPAGTGAAPQGGTATQAVPDVTRVVPTPPSSSGKSSSSKGSEADLKAAAPQTGVQTRGMRAREEARAHKVMNGRRGAKPSNYGPYAEIDVWMALKGMSHQECVELVKANPGQYDAPSDHGPAAQAAVSRDQGKNKQTAGAATSGKAPKAMLTMRAAVAAAILMLPTASASTGAAVGPAWAQDTYIWHVLIAFCCLTGCRIAIKGAGINPVRQAVAYIGSAAMAVCAIKHLISPAATEASWELVVRSGWAEPMAWAFIVLIAIFTAQWFRLESNLFHHATLV